MPPPRSTAAMLASVRSVVGNAEEFFSGMVSPRVRGSGDGSGGAVSSRCCEPSRLVCPILAVAFLGNLTSLSHPSVSVATQPLRRILRTWPTNASATKTRLLVLSASASGICTLMV
jgi:hypothetical protein